MPPEAEVAVEVIQKVANDVGYGKKVVNAMYRSDYQDYLVLLEDDFYFQIRQKLIETFLENPNEEVMQDIKKEIAFLLKTADRYDEFDDDGGESDPTVV